jgi:predicted esterase
VRRSIVSRATQATLTAIAAIALLAGPAAAQPAPAPRAPCAGCTLDLPPARTAPLPMLVVLHGDRGRADQAAARWRAAAKARGWALLSLQCPVALGCTGSWWQWDGDPAWITAQVDAVADQLAIDSDRVYLAGWSGGATYMGKHAPVWTGTFAAVVIHGGGEAPDEACPKSALPAYFLVGDKNPLHGLARELRGWFDDCAQELVWDLVAHGDHDLEDRALDRAKALHILDWLAARPRAPLVLRDPEP